MSTTTQMATIGPTSSRHTPTQRRSFARAFALGATVSALALGGTYTVVGSGGTDHAGKGAAAANTSHVAAGGSGAARTTYQQGAWVVALQHKLAQLNYYEGPVDGVLGPQTRAAITDFQRANGLPADGIAGATTMVKIDRQLITGDSRMDPGAPAHKPATTNPTAPGSSGTVTTGGTTSPTGGAAVTTGAAAGTTPNAGGTTGGAAPSATTAAN